MKEKITILVESPDKNFALRQTNFIHGYLTRTCDLEDIQQSRKTLDENHAGGVLESILYITLNSASILAIAQALHVWLKRRAAVIEAERKEVSITIEFGNGKNITLTTKNVEDIDSVLNKIAQLIK